MLGGLLSPRKACGSCHTRAWRPSHTYGLRAWSNPQRPASSGSALSAC